MALNSVAETEALIAERMVPLARYRELLEAEPSFSPWLTVDQTMIDRFAVATHDHQFIHVDPERARAETPFGGTIAHGFLTLSLLSTLAYEAIPGVEGMRMGMNYGFDRIRFLNPVKAGSRVRGRFRMVGLTERAVSLQTTWDAAVEIEGAVKPALTAEWITLTVITPPGD
ncbi:MaoC family dehydratase [Jiella avicenniae]